MNDHIFNVHQRARRKRQNLAPGEASHDESSHDDASKEDVGEKNDVPLSAGAIMEESSEASSLFSHSDDGQLKDDHRINENDPTPREEHLDTKPPSNNVNNDDSSESLFSTSNDSDVKIIATTKPESKCPSSTLLINRMNASPAISAITGCGDDSVCSSLFSHDDDSAQEKSTGKTDNKQQQIDLTATYPSHTPQEKPVYLTFDRPPSKPDAESDIDSSDEGSLFSLNERTQQSPPTRRALTKPQNAKKVPHLTSFGTPAIPRKKIAALTTRPADLSVPVQTERSSRLCNKFGRQHSQGSPEEIKLKKKTKTRNRVSFAVPVKKRELVGKAARALKIAPIQDEPHDMSAAKTISPKADIAEDGIYFDWQNSYKEKLWSREFLKVKKYLREHGGNNDIPDGHSLFGWIRKQQKMCQKFVRASYDTKQDIMSDEDFQSFVHIFRLQKVGFEWASRTEHLVENSILEWSVRLNPMQQKVLQSYKDKPCRKQLPSPSARTNRTVNERVSDGDDECEFNDSFDGKDKRHKEGGKKKKRRRDNNISSSEKKNDNLRFEREEKKPIHVLDESFIDERPEKLSWNLHDQTISTKSGCGSPLPQTIQKKLLEINDTQTEPDISSTSRKTKQQLWFDLESCDSKSITHVSKASCRPSPPKSSSKKSSKRLWSEVQSLWSGVQHVQSQTVKPTEPVGSNPSSSTQDVPDKKRADGNKTFKRSKHKEAAKSVKESSTQKPPTIGTSDSNPMEPSVEFPGWLVKCVPRKTKGHDFYYFSPQLQFKFRSRPEVRRFIELLKERGDEATAMDDFKSQWGKSPQKKNKQQKNTVCDQTKKVKLNTQQHDETEKMLNKGDKVYAAWDKNKKLKSPVYFSGVITSARAGDGTNPQVYDVQFDDGDKLCDIVGDLVISKHDYLRNSLKHMYKVGDKVYSAWWPDKKRKKSTPAWYPGIVKCRRVSPRGGQYGPSVLYDILFDDGDEHFNVEDQFVFIKSDYEISTKQHSNDKNEWTGVRNVVDKTSIDPWAKVVGWYSVVIDGKEHTYPLLTDALRAYDSYTVSKLGSKTKKKDLNLPDEWIFSKDGAPTRLNEVTQIAGSKNVNINKKRTLSDDSRSKQSKLSYSVQQRHVMEFNGTKSNAESLIESDRETDSCDGMPTSLNEPTTCKTKPVFVKGEKVYALWSGGTDKWYSGRIWDINILPMSDKGYGPAKTFDVIYDDGEIESGIKEIYVMKKVDYELCITREDKEWVGVTNVTEKDSEDEYARTVGWYEVHIEETNEKYVFSSLNEALRFHDKNLTKRNACVSIPASKLNFPSELGT